MPKSEPWRYEKLTWPEINQAIDAKKVVVVPIGSTEQHGPHLPLDVDVVCPSGVAHAAARLIPDEVLVMPPIVHGYTGHVMDFPGTINIHWEHFIKFVMDVGKSLAYHGFKKWCCSTVTVQMCLTLTWQPDASTWRRMPSVLPALGG